MLFCYIICEYLPEHCKIGVTARSFSGVRLESIDIGGVDNEP